MKKIVEKLVIFIPLIGGVIVGLLIGTDSYKVVNKPPLSPPGIVFPIAWSILYLLMGISYYMVDKDKKVNFYFWSQLLVNYAWSFLFFNLKIYLFSALWIMLLIYLVINMILVFYDKKKIAGYMNVGYLIWLLFALYLNIGVYILN